MMFCVMEMGISFERAGLGIAYQLPEALETHRAFFERIFKAREGEILLYIDSGGVSSEVPTAENLVAKARALLRPESPPDD
jgi:hypothetical protein